MYNGTTDVEFTLRELAVLMISLSDNTATGTLQKHLTDERRIKNIIVPLGLKATRIYTTCEKMITKFYGRPVI